MNHSSINTSALFGIHMFFDSSIYGITITRASTVIPRAAIERPCVCSLQIGDFGYLGSIWCVFLVV